jgi:hypothetical protein
MPLTQDQGTQPTVPDQQVPPEESPVDAGDPEAEQEVGGG